ncbi:MAG TPA: hypothetical protein VEH81_15195, partial [Ktedonobacteraceae bacterium]|nr:hypothetical protein [Ktedonobacteraceae bacterium]
MAEIQFGWVLNGGPKREMSSREYNEISRRQVELLREQIASLWFVDHVQFGDSPVLEGWTALTYFA